MKKLDIGIKLISKLRWDTKPENITVVKSALGDFNKDGITDIAITGMDRSSVTNDIRILLGNRNGDLYDGTQLVLSNAIGSYQTSSIVSVDLNHDGYSDLVVARSSGDLDTTDGVYADSQLIYLSNSKGVYTAIVSDARLYAHNAAVSDFNNDGNPDAFFLATAKGPSVLMLNSGATSNSLQFTTRGVPEKGLRSTTSEAWDVLEYHPNGSFKLMKGWHHHNTAFNDVNRDGFVDMVMFFAGSQNGLIYLNSGETSPRFDQARALTFNAVLKDIPSTGYFLQGILKDDGSWAGLRSIKQGTSYYETIQFDVDEDGWEDIIAVATSVNSDYTDLIGSRRLFNNGTDDNNRGTFYQVLLNNGMGLTDDTDERITQPDVSRTTKGHYSHSHLFSAVDLNGDGKLDFMSNSNNSSRIGIPNWAKESDTVFMLNDGAGVFKQVGIDGFDFNSYTPFPVQGKLGFLAIVPSSDSDWSLPGSPPRAYWEIYVFQSNIPWTVGDDGNNYLYGTAANDQIDGGAGLDTFQPLGRRDTFDLTLSGGKFLIEDKRGLLGQDTLVGVERVKFYDVSVALDLDGSAGQAYRIYKAAFNRDPIKGDTQGLGYWIAQIDNGMNLVEVSARFIDSQEFKTLYGMNPTNAEFLTKLYQNVLGRQPEVEGYDWWLNQLNNNPEKSRAKVLADFAESEENQSAVLTLIASGITYDPWGG